MISVKQSARLQPPPSGQERVTGVPARPVVAGHRVNQPSPGSARDPVHGLLVRHSDNNKAGSSSTVVSNATRIANAVM